MVTFKARCIHQKLKKMVFFEEQEKTKRKRDIMVVSGDLKLYTETAIEISYWYFHWW